MALVGNTEAPPSDVFGEIVSTVEYYFSDANLLTDAHLHSLMARDTTGGFWVRLDDLLRFPRLKRLTTKATKAKGAAAVFAADAGPEAVAGAEGTQEAASEAAFSVAAAVAVAAAAASAAPVNPLANLLAETLRASPQLEVGIRLGGTAGLLFSWPSPPLGTAHTEI